MKLNYNFLNHYHGAHFAIVSATDYGLNSCLPTSSNEQTSQQLFGGEYPSLQPQLPEWLVAKRIAEAIDSQTLAIVVVLTAFYGSPPHESESKVAQ